jgi:hypothetical protein
VKMLRRPVRKQLSSGSPTPIATPYPGHAIALTEEETAALAQELRGVVQRDKYPFSARTRTLRAILAKLRPEPVRKPLLLPKVYAPPKTVLSRRRLAGR